MSDPIHCWAWHEGSRTTAPSIHLIRDIIDGRGVGVNGYIWARVQRIAAAPTTEQPRPSALSRIWAILRGRE